ncbi:MAG TPA: hypothetical protein VFY69_03200, partial [Solirubrobacterales bacterium]|nr:hypothetical protein [Solirubrobacterales bacterium]
MKYVKMLGLLAVAAAAMMAFAGIASATVTSGGSAYTGEISASSTNSELDGTVDVKCKQSTVAGSTTSGATSSSISTLTFTECGSDTVSVVKKGSLSISSSGGVTSSGAEVTVQVHRSIFGFPITTHCIYATGAGTEVGQLTEGTTTIHLLGTDIPRLSTDSGCGENSQWTGTYTI